MTTHKHRKGRVRARMARTGERYAVARAHIVPEVREAGLESSIETVRGIRHFAGANPATTALRTLVTHASVRDHGGAPLSEGLLLVIGGGIGAGVFAFRYEKEDVSTLFLGGRHRWDDDLAFIEQGARRLGIATEVRETGSSVVAERNLRGALEAGPAIAWVDAASLGTRGYPDAWTGGGYHVVAVYDVDVDGAATIGDLAAAPIRVPAADFARARARIGKQKNRVLIARAADAADTGSAIRSGLQAGVEALTDPRRRNFGLVAFHDLAGRMHGSSGKDSWSRVFPRGRHLFEALGSLHRFVEGYGSGGGLVRTLFADGLGDAASLSGDERLLDAGNRYAALGREWTALARAALPDAFPLLAEARSLQERQDVLYRSHGPDALDEIRRTWDRLDEIAAIAGRAFPLSPTETDDLLADLATRLRAIHRAEEAALETLRATLA